jgi:hypothetical protein
LVACLIITAVWAIANARWAVADMTVPWDAKNQFYAFFRFLAQSLHAGTSIFWNPYHYGGHPSIADPQSLVFAPLFLAWAYLDPAPSMAAFDMVVYAHLLVGGLAFVGLGARRHWPVSAIVLAGCVFMFGGAAAGRLNHTGIIIAYGLFPLAVLLLEVTLARRSLAAAVGFAIVASLIALGRNQVAMLLCLVLAAMAIADIAGRPKPLAALTARLPVLATILAVGIAINLVPLLLTLQFAALSNRPTVTLANALEASLHPSVLLTAAVPNLFGSHNMDWNYWGPHYTIMPEVASTDDSFNYVFFGAVPVLLLVWFGIAGRHLAAPALRFWTVVLLISVLFSVGRYTPLFAIVFETLPGFSFFRRPIDGMFVAGVALAFLSGHLLSAYARHGLPVLGRWTSLAVALSLAALIASALSVANMSHKVVAASLEIGKSGLIVAAAVGVLAWAARSPSWRPVAAAFLTLVAAIELVAWNAATRLNAEPTAVYGPLEPVSADQQAALDVLHAELDARRRQGARPRVEIVAMGGPWQNVSMVQEIEATNGYNPLRIGLYDRFVAAGETAAAGRVFTRTFRSFDCEMARALGVEYVVSGKPIEELGQLGRAAKAELIHRGPGIHIYRLPKAEPRAIFHARLEVADADAVTLDGALRNPPRGDRAVIDDETPIGLAAWMAPVTTAEGSARIRSWEPGRVEIDVHAPTAGVVVLHDTYYPGWVATLNDKPATMLRADTLFRGVEVPAGLHRIVFEYRPLDPANLWDAARRIGGTR